MTFREKKSKLYDEREVVLAYLDAQRPPYPHEDFGVFRKNRLTALEAAYGIRMSRVGLVGRNAVILSMHFMGTADTLLKLHHQGSLEGGLLVSTINTVDSDELKLRENDVRMCRHLDEAKLAGLDLLVSLFMVIWGPITNPLTSEELAARGFDDSREPQIQDYYDYM